MSGTKGKDIKHRTERPAIGAIRWDACFDDAFNPYEQNLLDAQ